MKFFTTLAVLSACKLANAQAPGAGAPVAGGGDIPTLSSTSSSTSSTSSLSSSLSAAGVSPVAQSTAAAAATEPVAQVTARKLGLAGTWSSQSNAVFTGPDFYDPVDELLIEPALPGISYSFTDDGFWEEAIYQVSANPREPGCPSAVLIFQHGTYKVLPDNSLVLTPFAVDGRQLVSDPCKSSSASYLRYNQTETFKSYEVSVDNYYGRWRLDMYAFDGAPLHPMYLAYSPPQMLDTITLNPTASAPAATASSVAQKVRRSLENRSKTTAVRQSTDLTALWWLSVTLVIVGATGWFIAK